MTKLRFRVQPSSFLGCSLKSVRPLTFRSNSRIWAELHERRLGRATRIVVLDNLREGVLVPDVYDPLPIERDVCPEVNKQSRHEDSGSWKRTIRWEWSTLALRNIDPLSTEKMSVDGPYPRS